MDPGLKDKSAAMAAGASNIGRASFSPSPARRPYHRGRLDAEQAEKVADLARKRAPERSGRQTDVTDLDQVKAMFKTAIERNGTVDVLVNNVGWDQFMSLTQTMLSSAEDHRDQLCRHAELHQMRARHDDPNKAGAIVPSAPTPAVRRAARSGLWRCQGRDQLVHEDDCQGEWTLRYPLQCRLSRCHLPQTADEIGRREHVE